MTVRATVKLAPGASWFANDDEGLVVAEPDRRLDDARRPGHRRGRAVDRAARRGPLDGTVLARAAYIPDGKARTLLEVDLATGTIAAVDASTGPATRSSPRSPSATCGSSTTAAGASGGSRPRPADTKKPPGEEPRASTRRSRLFWLL